MVEKTQFNDYPGPKILKKFAFGNKFSWNLKQGQRFESKVQKFAFSNKSYKTRFLPPSGAEF